MSLRVLVFGAGGATGRHVVQQASERGWSVTAFVHDPARRPPDAPGVTVEVGDATDPGRLDAVVPGHDAVICVVGAPARSRDRVRERTTVEIVAAMHRAGVERLVALSSFGVGETRGELPWFLRAVVVPLYLARAFADHEAQEAVVRSSGLAWTLVRPPNLTNGPRVGGYRSEGPTASKIARADLATALLDQLLDSGPPRAVTVSASA